MNSLILMKIQKPISQKLRAIKMFFFSILLLIILKNEDHWVDESQKIVEQPLHIVHIAKGSNPTDSQGIEDEITYKLNKKDGEKKNDSEDLISHHDELRIGDKIRNNTVRNRFKVENRFSAANSSALVLSDK